MSRALTFVTFSSKIALTRYVNVTGLKQEDIQQIVHGKDITIYFWRNDDDKLG